jgi:Ferritin-like
MVMSNKIVELMSIPETQRDLPWLKKSLQSAVELELSTIPVYLCGLWSIKSDPSGIVSQLIRTVVWEEMIHMGIACNLLTALGQAPQIVSGYRNEIKYPTVGLPGGVRPGLTVNLSGLTLAYVQSVFMQIELPENPLTLAAATYPTIGAFYDAISKAFTNLKPALTTTNQLTTSFDDIHMNLSVISTVDEAVAAINEIKEQGEGTDTSTEDSPYTADYGNGPELSHYYKFSEIYYGATLIQKGGAWVYQGTPVPFPEVYPMAPIPQGGYVNPPSAVLEALQSFDGLFSSLLAGLDSAWGDGNNNGLQDAINVMFLLQPAAQALFNFELPDGSGVYGPDFVI